MSARAKGRTAPNKSTTWAFVIAGIIAVLVLAAVATAGCGSKATSPSPGATSPGVTLQSTTPPGTGTVDQITWDLTLGEPTTLDPLKAGDYGPCFVSSQLHDTLVRYSPDWKLGPGSPNRGRSLTT